MTGKDIWNFLAVYVAGLLIAGAYGLLRGHDLRETDHLTMLIIAAVSTICQAIHADQGDNW